MTTIKIATKEKDVFETEVETVALSDTLRNLIEELDDPGAETIPIFNLTTRQWKLVEKYMEHHKTEPPRTLERPLRSSVEDIISDWDKAYISMSDEDLFEAAMGAMELNIKPLVDLLAATIASAINGKTPAQIRERFKLPDDLTPEEKIRLEEDCRWAIAP